MPLLFLVPVESVGPDEFEELEEDELVFSLFNPCLWVELNPENEQEAKKNNKREVSERLFLDL